MSRLGEHAVVLGAGMAGLVSAGVLADFYESVTIVERDPLPDHPALRKGVPQGRHLHSFLSRGPQVIGELFPGLLDELVAAGAVFVNDGDLSRICARVGRYELNRTGRLADPKPLRLYQGSRPFMEFHVRQHIAAAGNVAILDNHEMSELVSRDHAVTGVRIVDRDTGGPALVDADLVVDAMGRATRTPNFMKQHGFGSPAEKRTATAWGYSSQLLAVPEGRIAERTVLINQGPKAPGGLLVAYENNTWMLAIARVAGRGNPPADYAEMMAAAEQIFPESIMAGLREGTPIAGVAVYRNTASLWRRYDRMRRLPDGLIVVGDALCHFNPLYGQGMTMAAMDALMLRDCLRAGTKDLPRRFFTAAAREIWPVWAMNQGNDRVFTAGTPNPLQRQLRKWTGDAALKAAATDIAVAERFLRVRNLVDPPARLQDPLLISRILLANLLHPC